MSHACSEGTKEEQLIEQCVQMFGQIKQIGIMNLQHTGSNTKIQSNSSVIQEAASVCKRQFYSWLYFSHQKHHN